MTLINTYTSQAEAALDAGMLKANGIDAVVQTNAIADLFPGAGNSPVSLYVPEKQVKEALKLLNISEG